MMDVKTMHGTRKIAFYDNGKLQGWYNYIGMASKQISRRGRNMEACCPPWWGNGNDNAES